MPGYVDFLVIGGGVAGLRAAIELAPRGEVLIITKDAPREGSTEYAQGGIAVALSDEDEVGIHYEDTLKAGDGLCNESAVKILVEEGPERITELISWGAEFDREGARLDFTMEAAHSRKRVLHAHGDATGRELERVLTGKALSFPSVRQLPFSVVVDLIAHEGRCIGAHILKGRRTEPVFARSVVMATGGIGQVYSVTTNPPVSTADGIAIAHRAGAHLKHMEFVQFHPTSLFLPNAPHFLLSEAMRGEGGRLLNAKGERFMSSHHPDGELAPRDIVSRAIVSEMAKTGVKHVFLDLTHLDAEFVKRRFPRIYRTCLQFDVDITHQRIPVSPAAHYMMGGVETDINGLSSLPGLYAAGECACTGVHGANRLASNSLLEGLVYGKRAGESASEGAVSMERLNKLSSGVPEFSAKPRTIADHDEIRSNLRRLMWERVGIIRSEQSLRSALDEMSGWSYVLSEFYPTRRELELKNMLQTGLLITEAALKRRGSAGAHYRSDFPKKAAD